MVVNYRYLSPFKSYVRDTFESFCKRSNCIAHQRLCILITKIFVFHVKEQTQYINPPYDWCFAQTFSSIMGVHCNKKRTVVYFYNNEKNLSKLSIHKGKLFFIYLFLCKNWTACYFYLLLLVKDYLKYIIIVINSCEENVLYVFDWLIL